MSAMVIKIPAISSLKFVFCFTFDMVCLGNPEEGQSKILRLLSVLLSSKAKAEEKKQILEEEFSIPMTQTLERACLICAI